MPDRRRRTTLGTARERPDARGKFVQIEGLDEVIVGARVQTFHTIGDGIARGEHQHRQGLAAASQGGENIQSAFLRQPEVEQHHIVGLRHHRGLGGGAIAHPVHAVAFALESKAHALRDHRVILDQQQPHGHLLPCPRKLLIMLGTSARLRSDRDYPARYHRRMSCPAIVAR